MAGKLGFIDVGVNFGSELSGRPPAATLPLGLLRRIVTAVKRELMRPERMRGGGGKKETWLPTIGS